MNLTEYSEHRGTSTRAVEEAILAGRITRSADGSIDPDIADAQWEINHDPAQRKRGRPRKGEYPANRAKRDPAIDQAAAAKHAKTIAELKRIEAEHLDADKLGKLTFADARALKENFEAKLKKVDLDERMGLLITRDRVERGVETACRVARDRLLNIPSRIAASIAAMTEIADIHDAISEEIREACEELAASLGRIAEGNPQ